MPEKPSPLPKLPCRRCGVVCLHSRDGQSPRQHWCTHSHYADVGSAYRVVPHMCAEFSVVPFITGVHFKYQVGCRECAAAHAAQRDAARRALALGGLEAE